MSSKDKNIELRSDEIQDILGKIPPWVIRRGMMGIALVVIALLAIAAWFKYPDRITSPIQLTTDHPPVHLVARTTAKIDEFFVTNNQEVNKGDLLVVLESSANYKDVLAVRDSVSKLTVGPEDTDTSFLLRISSLKNLDLGNLQGDFAALQKSIQVLLDYLSFDKYQILIKGIEKELHSLNMYYNRLYDQKLNKQKEFEIATSQYNRKLDLHEGDAISDLELEEAEQIYYSHKDQLDGARVEMSIAHRDSIRLEQELNKLKIDKQEEEINTYAQILENKDKFLGAMADWELTYLMISPIQGQISLTNNWYVNQEVKIDSRVLTIVQKETGPILGKVLLPNLGAGKVKEGHSVIVRFDRYPYMEFGLVSGVINSISLVPEEANYYVKVGFPNGLYTSYDQELKFTQEMTGQAEIITEDRSFLGRIVSPLKSMLKRNTIKTESDDLTE